MVVTAQFTLSLNTTLVATGSRGAVVQINPWGGAIYIGGDSTVSPSTGFLIQGGDSRGALQIPLKQGNVLYAIGDPSGFITVLLVD